MRHRSGSLGLGWTPDGLTAQYEHAARSGWLTLYEEAARRHGVRVPLLLAKDSRESCLGLCLDSDFKGDNGHGWGLAQIDDRTWTEFTSSTDPRNHRAILSKGAEILRAEIDRFGGNERAGLAAYNTGPGRVRAALRRGLNVDTYTTGKDYSADVLARRDVFANLYTPPLPPAAASFSAPGGWLLAGLMLTGFAYYQRRNA